MYNNSVFRREKEEAPAKVDGGIFGLLQYRRVPEIILFLRRNIRKKGEKEK